MIIINQRKRKMIKELKARRNYQSFLNQHSLNSNSSQNKMLEKDSKNSDQSLKLRTENAELEKMQLVNDKLENEKLQLQMGLDVMTQKLNIAQRNNAIYEEKIQVLYKYCLKFPNSLQQLLG